ncbi:hypothetical protein KM043_012382 [Ampulex compressa]|nr:hypothetical protein KM043_012382 [Ampulex compressa]
MKNFLEVLFPLFWIEEGILLDDQFLNKLKTVFTIISIVGVFKWLMVLGGLGRAGAAAGLHFKRTQSSNKLDITKVMPSSGSMKETGQEKKWPPTMNISTIQNTAGPPITGINYFVQLQNWFNLALLRRTIANIRKDIGGSKS